MLPLRYRDGADTRLSARATTALRRWRRLRARTRPQGFSMKCFYCLAPALMSTRQVSDDPHAAGVSDFFIHVVSKDESGLKQHHSHSSSYLETLDVVRSGFIGAGLGFVAGLAGFRDDLAPGR